MQQIKIKNLNLTLLKKFKKACITILTINILFQNINNDFYQSK